MTKIKPTLEDYMTPQRQQIADLWNENHSAGAIAGKLGVTRNAIVGLVQRMRQHGVELRSAEVMRSSITKPRLPRRRPEPAPPVLPPRAVVEKHKPPPIMLPPIERPPVTANRWVPLLETLRDTCRYSSEENKFCNAPGFPWCDEHRKRCYTVGKS